MIPVHRSAFNWGKKGQNAESSFFVTWSKADGAAGVFWVSVRCRGLIVTARCSHMLSHIVTGLVFPSWNCMFFLLTHNTTLSNCMCMIKPLALPLTASHMNGDASLWAFHCLQSSTGLHVNRVSVCYLISKALAGDFLMPRPIEKQLWTQAFLAVVSFLYGLAYCRFDKEKWERRPLCTDTCKYSMELTVLFFLM